jgi:hypothetical protein
MNRTKAGLVLFTILILAVGGGAIMMNPHRTHSRGQVGRSSARVFEKVPDHKAYEFLFHRITFHRKRAATAGKPEAVDGALQREGHLSLDQMQSLEIIATNCLSEVEKQDAAAHIVIKAFREKYFPDGKIPVGGELPPPPPELEIMQQKRDAILQRGRSQVLEMLGGGKSAEFDSFVKERFAGKLPDAYANPMRQPNLMEH